MCSVHDGNKKQRWQPSWPVLSSLNRAKLRKSGSTCSIHFALWRPELLIWFYYKVTWQPTISFQLLTKCRIQLFLCCIVIWLTLWKGFNPHRSCDPVLSSVTSLISSSCAFFSWTNQYVDHSCTSRAMNLICNSSGWNPGCWVILQDGILVAE